MMRTRILNKIVKDLLGPKNGYDEIVAFDPSKQYITGVLSPNIQHYQNDPDQEAELISEFKGGKPTQDDYFVGDISDSFSSATVLNPKIRPRSIGFSFNLLAENDPILSICVTWARYLVKDELYERKPKAKIIKKIVCNKNIIKYYLDSNGNICGRNDAEICITILIKKQPNNYYISIYLINEILLENEKFIQPHEFIYQPQIRLNIDKGKLDSIDIYKNKDKEEIKLDFLYRKKKVLSRGHMCSVYWKEIDIEQEHKDKFEDVPFFWVDGQIIDENERGYFYNPDLRSEFIPAYNIKSPDYVWDVEKWGSKPELNTLKLSEMWNKNDIEEKLKPMIDGYKKWISVLKNDSEYNQIDNKSITNAIIQETEDTLRRMEKGVKTLIDDENARISFCFSNKVIAQQYEWNLNMTFEWRPFQLAFILMCLESISNFKSDDREICDLLFVPTGTGKTEAYLALAAYTMAYSRRMNIKKPEKNFGSGCNVIMRYTLRLLTIQQYRRALRMVTASEFLRVYGLSTNDPVGWRPKACSLKDHFIWGIEKFSIGLWVGGGVSPNRMQTFDFSRRPVLGAIDLLRRKKGEGDPAQILNCPACSSILSIPENGINSNSYKIHLIINSKIDSKEIKYQIMKNIERKKADDITIKIITISEHENKYYTLNMDIECNRKILSKEFDNIIESMMDEINQGQTQFTLIPVKPSRPGYFLKYIKNRRGVNTPFDFEIYCPNPECPLHYEKGIWIDGKPSNTTGKIKFNSQVIQAPEKTSFNKPADFLCINNLSMKIPIPAYTVDEQIYARCPSFIVATVDKFARLPFEPRSGSIFGNVDHYDENWGYYREGLPPYSSTESGKHPVNSSKTRMSINAFEPPKLIIQDELHLIEGPLGSMVGIYETAIDYLSSEEGIMPKYLSSTATIKGASEQINSIFYRILKQFPSSGFDVSDKYFIKNDKFTHPIEEIPPGRLYIGLCAPGWGSLTPVYRLWSIALQTSYELSFEFGKEIDPFWTLVGYFNSIRELAGARSMYRQDIPGRIKSINENYPRNIPIDRIVELSSRLNSTELPMMLDEMANQYSGDIANPNTLDSIFTTSMFGTGVDISRLSLMIVHGQPKTTASYIQATGRVGRKRGGLVVTLYNAARPRDLSHYEMFCGYHSNIDRFVEPITVAPFSPGTLARCAGPVIVSILRNMRNSSYPWHHPDSANGMKNMYKSIVEKLTQIFINRRQRQPEIRTPEEKDLVEFIKSEIEKWYLSSIKNQDLKYVEYRTRTHPVVLGDSVHSYRDLGIVYENAPQSLRDIEETTGFQTK